MKNLISQYIEISSEEEMEKASKWLESKGYENDYGKIYNVEGTYLFIRNNNKFHFNIGDKQSYWKPFSILYDEGMPRDVPMGYRTAEITSSIDHIARDEEDLLAKAKSLYPIGTKYKCAAGGYGVHTVVSMDWYPSPPGHIYGEIGKGSIYKHGKWAEIVHEVKPVVELQSKDIVPEYVEFTNSNGWFKKGEYEIGKIYKWSHLTSGVVGEYGLNADFSRWTEEFKPSTKEAYETQQLIAAKEKVSECVEWKPQIGDWVVTDNLRINDTGDGRKYNGTIGQIWKIGSIHDEWYRPVEEMHFTGGSLKLHNLRKATQQEIDSMSNISSIIYSYTGPIEPQKETHQSINKTGKQFSPIKVELIKVKQLKIN